jgi:predicted Rossmann fold flavoprotein
MKKVAIIGGGAAGMMAAASMIENGYKGEIHLFEKNPSLGAKVIISGGGRCNVTTGIHDHEILCSKYTRGGSFLEDVLSEFSPKKVIDWFEHHGVPLKTEGDQRVFPVSDNGKDVVGAFAKVFSQYGLHLHLSESVKGISPGEKSAFALVSNKGEYQFDSAIITTGGNAYSHTGSSGDGYAFAKAFGHTVTQLGPSLNSFLCGEAWPKELSGVSLASAKLTTRNELGKEVSAIGPFLFTHFGISGPVTFALSSHIAFMPISKTHSLQISLSPISSMELVDWDKYLQKMFQGDGARQVSTILAKALPQRFTENILKLAGTDPKMKCAEISKQKRRDIAEWLSGGVKLTLLQRRPGDEFVTAGGVTLSEVDEHTMSSKLNPNLFFAGEILDIDGLTGGFNLQSSWATGWRAGKSVTHESKQD